MHDMTYLFLAYTIIWMALFIYVLQLGRRLARLQKQLDALKK